MVITRKRLSRRTVLRGAGALVALPMLDAMAPALGFLRAKAAAPARRLGIFYVPNGMMMKDWTPAGEGSDFAFGPIMQPLAPFRDHMLVLSGLNNKNGWALPGEGTGDHARAPASFLSGVHVKKTEGADLHAGLSMDQVAARELGQQTQFASLEIGLESIEMSGSCDGGYSCAYSNTISWRTPTTPLPMEDDPRALFERLFGSSTSTDAKTREIRIHAERSLLDSVTDKVSRLQQGLGPADRVKLTEYLDAIRDAERRIQKAEEQSTRELPIVPRPAGIPASYEEHAKLMFDLLALAYQCDLTRISTFMLAHEVSNHAYPEAGVPEAHHDTSHHQNDPVKLEKLSKINTFHARMFAHFVEKLRSIPDLDGSLLDQSMLLYGAGISDSNVHMHDNLPLVLVGGGGGQVKGGRYVSYAKGTPLMNLHMTLLDILGVRVENLGDSTGRLNYLSDIA
jgi:hypothetical protein